LLLSDREELVGRKIAISDIESIEFESFNWLTTSLLILGIAVTAFVAFVFLADWGPST
jgi:hypothetical protein